MQLKFLELVAHLQQSLLPFYLISTREESLAQEAVFQIIQRARQHGFEEIEKDSVTSSFDWKQWEIKVNHFSLFVLKKVIVLTLSSLKISEVAHKILHQLTITSQPDRLFIITTPRLDKKQLSSVEWIKDIGKAGAILQIWPLSNSEFTSWAHQQCRQRELRLTSSAYSFLTRLTEGNLLACLQAVQKLQLIYGKSVIDQSHLEAILGDSAEFDVITFVDQALLGASPQVLRILERLQTQKVEPILILWGLTQAIYTLLSLFNNYLSKIPLTISALAPKIVASKQPFFQKAHSRHTLESCRLLLHHAAQVDWVLKGQKPGDIWDLLRSLALFLSTGRPVLHD